MSRKKHQRKKVYVSRQIQGRIVSKLAVYWATYHLALWHAMFLFHYFLYRGQLMADPQMARVPFQIQYFQFLTQHYTMLVCALAVFPLILWDMMKVTHRVAGPLVRFTNCLEQLKRGEKVRKIQLRDGDYLVEFQDAFNSYLKSIDMLAGDEGRCNARSEGGEVLDELRDLSEAFTDGESSSSEAAEQSGELQTVGAGS